jgi:hypothetical protein
MSKMMSINMTRLEEKVLNDSIVVINCNIQLLGYFMEEFASLKNREKFTEKQLELFNKMTDLTSGKYEVKKSIQTLQDSMRMVELAVESIKSIK